MYAELLSVRIIPNVAEGMRTELKLAAGHRSLAMFTVDMDDVGVTALDEATKRADVEAVYARSFYAGADNGSGPLSGEFIGMLAGADPDSVMSGMDAVRDVVGGRAHFEAINEEKTHALFAHVISRTGSFLSKEANVAKGASLAYVIAPPLEAMYGLDAALKASDVELKVFYGPPTETNFGGGLLSGSQSSCTAAAEAFREAVLDVAAVPDLGR